MLIHYVTTIPNENPSLTAGMNNDSQTHWIKTKNHYRKGIAIEFAKIEWIFI